jgi:hypothetical protein
VNDSNITFRQSNNSNVQGMPCDARIASSDKNDGKIEVSTNSDDLSNKTWNYIDEDYIPLPCLRNEMDDAQISSTIHDVILDSDCQDKEAISHVTEETTSISSSHEKYQDLQLLLQLLHHLDLRL